MVSEAGDARAYGVAMLPSRARALVLMGVFVLTLAAAVRFPADSMLWVMIVLASATGMTSVWSP